MMKVIEAFSGIGSQAKALKNIGIEHEIFATVEWDINAVIAYDLIHNGKQDLSQYEDMTKLELREKLSRFTLSPNGKEPYTASGFNRLSEDLMKKLLCAINRCNNLTSITDIKGTDLPGDIDLFTYSFPCQDLSLAGVWHGNFSGIDRDANNRSGMLWEVERILKEQVENDINLPKFLLMENVSNILSPRHKGNFDEWTSYLEEIGYYNKIYSLNSKDFGMPQNRKRVFMLSVYVGKDDKKRNAVKEYLTINDLSNQEYLGTLHIKNKSVKEILRVNYSIDKYRREADESQPNNTRSRDKIFDENEKIVNVQGNCVDVIKTITTKQDRNPNSGVIVYNNNKSGNEKAVYRTLTPRECFLFMGFDESDFDSVVDGNFYVTANRKFFTHSKLIKMAGNSIVVNVLEAIFKQVADIKEQFHI